MFCNRMEYTEEKKRYFWRKAKPVDGEDKNEVRRDASGAIIHYSDYKNRDSDYGWEIDHIYPKSLLEDANVPENMIDDPRNLRPMNWKNNVSKGCDYPLYTTVVIASRSVNIEKKGTRVVNAIVQQALKELYKDYLG